MDRNEALLRELKLYPQWRMNLLMKQQYARSLPVAVDLTVTAEEVRDVIASPTVTGEQHSDLPVMPSTMTAQTQWAVQQTGWSELKQLVRDCRACSLRGGCTQTVFGVGDDRAAWLFVGEAPGEQEDVRGEPFVGQAGKLLDNMLMSMKLRRGENVYIANVVKCRPPGNRTPQPGEVASCLPYLQRQIDLIQPDMIVALGRAATSALLGADASLGSLRGTLHEYRGIPVVVTYHPSYLLRCPMEKMHAWQDLRLALHTMTNCHTRPRELESDTNR